MAYIRLTLLAYLILLSCYAEERSNVVCHDDGRDYPRRGSVSYCIVESKITKTPAESGGFLVLWFFLVFDKKLGIPGWLGNGSSAALSFITEVIMQLSNEVITQAAKAAGVEEGCKFFLISERKRWWQTVSKMEVVDGVPTILLEWMHVPGHIVADTILQNVEQRQKGSWIGRFISRLRGVRPPIFLVVRLTTNRHELVLVGLNQQPLLKKGKKIAIEFEST